MLYKLLSPVAAWISAKVLQRSLYHTLQNFILFLYKEQEEEIVKKKLSPDFATLKKGNPKPDKGLGFMQPK